MCESIVVAVGGENPEKLARSHFGDSEVFLIYRVNSDGRIKKLEERINKAKEVEEERHGDPRKFRAVVNLLADVDVLVAWAMGPNYVMMRDKSDKVPYILRGKARKSLRVNDALEEVVEHYDEICRELIAKRSRKGL